MINEMKFTKSSNQKKYHFFEACVLDKAHKMHSKTSVVHRANTIEKRLHSDLFEGENTLSNVEDFRYEVIMIDDHTRMKFLIILK